MRYPTFKEGRPAIRAVVEFGRLAPPVPASLLYAAEYCVFSPIGFKGIYLDICLKKTQKNNYFSRGLKQMEGLVFERFATSLSVEYNVLPIRSRIKLSFVSGLVSCEP